MYVHVCIHDYMYGYKDFDIYLLTCTTTFTKTSYIMCAALGIYVAM